MRILSFVMVALCISSLKTLAQSTVEGTVAVQLIYKQGYEVTNVKINGEEMVPTKILIDGIPSSQLAVDWSDSAIVKNVKTGKQVVIQFEKPKKSGVLIDEDSKVNLEIKPKMPGEKMTGDYEGTYDLNLTY